jgi:anti-sigma regulatory factor (Ser/Thr protein kinase)
MSADLPTTFTCRFPNNLPALSHATEQAMAFLTQHGINGQAAYAINLAIEELATNILKYGYDDTAEHFIGLQAEVQPHKVVLVLEDDGHEFNPLQAPPPDLSLSMDEREPGGLGICLVRQFSEHVNYERRDGKNRLTIMVAY